MNQKRIELLKQGCKDTSVQQYVREIERHLDTDHGSCLLRDLRNVEILGNAIHHFDADRYSLGAYCIMPNHYHVVLTPLGGNTLSDIIQSWNGFSAYFINVLNDREGRLWFDEFYDTIPRDRDHLWNIVQYIGRNPWKAHIPEECRIRWINPAWRSLGWDFFDAPNRGRFESLK
ncbi:MAG: putative transposase [Rhodothermales bacterium]|jgi:putative transposase